MAAAFLLVAGASVTALGEGALRTSLAAAQNAIDPLSERSPGARTRADMTKGKPRLDVSRVARALPRIRDAAPAAAAAALPAPGPAAPAFALPPEEDGPAAIFPLGGGDFAGFGRGPGGGIAFLPTPGGPGGIGGGGGGGGIITPQPPETPGPPVATTPIPEPATWATMILGFGVSGAVLRRRTRRDCRPA